MPKDQTTLTLQVFFVTFHILILIQLTTLRAEEISLMVPRLSHHLCYVHKFLEKDFTFVEIFYSKQFSNMFYEHFYEAKFQ